MAHIPEDPKSASPEPRGFGEHTRRSSSENAHAQGWGLNEDERRYIPPAQQRRGGTDDDYVAQDFGDTPADRRTAQSAAGTQLSSGDCKSQDVEGEADRKEPARRKTA